MKIAFFTDTFLPQVNGVATSIANFAIELGKRGNKVLIICPAPKSKRPAWVHENVSIVDLPSMPAFVYPEFRMSPLMGVPRALGAIKKFNPDVIHFHTTLSIAVDALLAAKIFKKPLVGTNHLFLTEKNNDSISFLTKNPVVLRYITKAAVACSLAFYAPCDVRISPSKQLIDALRKEGYKHPIVCLPNAVPTENNKVLSAGEAKAMRKKYGLREHVVLHVGRLSSEKKVEDVIKSFAIVAKKRSDVSLLVVGDGPARKDLEKLVKKSKLSDSVTFTGFIPNGELIESGLVGIADAFVTASPMEAQGMVLVEAMSFKVPVVAVAECAVPEVVGDNGFLVKAGDIKGMADRVQKLVSDPAVREKMGKLAFKRSKDFSIEITTTKLLSLYRTAIERQRKGGKKHKRVTPRKAARRAASSK